MASNGDIRILDIKPDGIHQRTPFMVGSKREMEALLDGRVHAPVLHDRRIAERRAK
jgi:fructose-1,6-bisphosphatase